MVPALLFATLLTHGQALLPLPEPDGSRTLGVVPPYTGKPDPPDWLRAKSYGLAALDCRHYLYEAYGNAKGLWLVRYVSFPESGEAFRELEQTFLFTSEITVKAEELKSTAVQFDPLAAIYTGKTFVLVDRRDLMRP